MTQTFTQAQAPQAARSTPDQQDPTVDVFDPAEDKLREECGIFGIFGMQNAASLTALGLHALQHRGQEACGQGQESASG